LLTLDRSTVRLDARVPDKLEAIRGVGRLLVESGHIKAGYVDSMLAREKVADTYLGNGVAIPHGLPKDRELIVRTGIAVLQVPAGVEWNPGERVRLVVGIAARSDEHLEILANLTRVLDNEVALRRLAETRDIALVIEVLSHGAPAAVPVPARSELTDLPRRVEVALTRSAGLHARPATVFVELAKQFVAEVRVGYGAKFANGKSLMSLLKLGVERGGRIRISAQGPDEAEAVAALAEAVGRGLGDEHEVREVVTHGWVPAQVEATVPGLSAAPGLAIGRLHSIRRRKLVFEATARDPVAEEHRLHQAIAAALVDLERLHHEVQEHSGAAEAAIFLAHREFLEDPELIGAALALIRLGHSCGWAWQKVVTDQAHEMEAVADPVVSGRAVDLRDVGTRVLRLVAGVVDEVLSLPSEPVLLVAEDLAPSDMAKLDPAVVLGLCTALGGPTSHTAILARSLGIPAVVGAGPAVLHQPDGALAILDGSNGVLYVGPSPADLEAAHALQKELRVLRDAEHRTRFEPAVTRDGHRVEVVANIGLVSEAEQAVLAGGEGVGLLRTEFLFLERAAAPTEEEQYNAYAAMATALNGLPLILRTLDVGGDKQLPYLGLPAEDNPFLGVRGIRLCLARPELFLTQLRAAYRASKHGLVKLMFPMVATLEELLAGRELAERARKEVGAEPLEIGIMVEVPAAAEMADAFAPHVDFFSVGTNDLTQYVLAMDRGHPVLSPQADGLHPAVLRMIDRTVRAATAAGKWVGVCGGVAGDPLGAAILIGLGVFELSVSIPAIPAIKARIRRLELAEAQELARRALRCTSAAEVRRLATPAAEAGP
jgi:multiphosphoryl transfer protein